MTNGDMTDEEIAEWMEGFAYLPPNRTPFITSRKELPHRKPSAEHLEMRDFFRTHDFIEVRNPETGDSEFKAVLKK